MMCPFCGRVNLPGADGCARCHSDLTQFTRPAGQDRVEAHILEDRCSEATSRDISTIADDSTLGMALQMMVDAEVGALLVIDGGGQVGGTHQRAGFSCVRWSGRIEDYAFRPISQFMTRDPETVQPDDSLALALRKMDLGSYRHLPVVEEGRPTWACCRCATCCGM